MTPAPEVWLWRMRETDRAHIVASTKFGASGGLNAKHLRDGGDMWVELLAYDLILRRWLANPRASRREIGVLSAWESNALENDKPPSDETVTRMKSFYRKHAPSGTFNRRTLV